MIGFEISPKVIFEDEVILVLDKPAGIVVNRTKTVRAKTIQDWVEEKLRVPRHRVGRQSSTPQSRQAEFEVTSDFAQRSGIVHRLDKETSGLLLVAKTPEAFKNLQRQFKERKVTKEYLALVHGQVEPKEGVIRASIARNPLDRKKFGVFLGGRKAETRYRAMPRRPARRGDRQTDGRKGQQFTLLELKPKTGRTHQLRVHLKHLGYPIVGDAKYAGRKTARADREWCPRQFLHASYLDLAHPRTGRRVEFTSPLPSQLRKVLQTLPRTVKNGAGFTLLI